MIRRSMKPESSKKRSAISRSTVNGKLHGELIFLLLIVVAALAQPTETLFLPIVRTAVHCSLEDAPLPYLSHIDYYFLYKWNTFLKKNPSINRYDHLDLLREGWSNLSRQQQALFRKVSDLDRHRYIAEMTKRDPSWDPAEANRYNGTFLKKGVYRSPLFYYLWTQFYSHVSQFSLNENVNARLVSYFEKWNKLSEKSKKPYTRMSVLFANEYNKDELKEGEICLSSFPIYPTAATYYCSILNEYRSSKDPYERQVMEVLRSEYAKLSKQEQLPFVTILNEVREKRKESLKAQEGK